MGISVIDEFTWISKIKQNLVKIKKKMKKQLNFFLNNFGKKRKWQC